MTSRKYLYAAVMACAIIVILVLLIERFYTPTPPSPRPPPTSPGLEEITPSKEPENVPEEFYPLKLSWVMEKSSERTDMFYASSLPRVPELIFKINISANIGGLLAEAVVESDKIFLADHNGVYALSRDNGSLIWGVEVYSDSLEGRAGTFPQQVTKWRALGLGRFVKAYGLGKYLYVGTSFGVDKDAYLIALNKDNGEIVWKVMLESEGNATSKASATSNLVIAEGRIFIGCTTGYVFCITEEGVFQWRKKVEGNVRGITYGGDLVYVSSEYSTKLYAINPKTGETVWIFDHNDGLNTPIYKSKRIILSDVSGNLLVVSDDGKLLWKKPLGIATDVNTNSFIAVDNYYVYAVRGLGERPRNLFILNLDGNILGNFTIEKDEDSGRPLVSNDVVILPVKSNNYNKVYFLWRGIFKLYEIKLVEKEEVWMPRISAAYGEIYVVANPSTLYKFADVKKPLIGDIETRLDGGMIKINVSTCDKESGLYRVYLVYSLNGSDWKYQLMSFSMRTVIEPIGGYGFGETPFPYDTAIEIPEGSITLEIYVLAIDNVGNYEISPVYAYRIRR